jgi:hypothetical protein
MKSFRSEYLNIWRNVRIAGLNNHKQIISVSQTQTLVK